MRNILLIVVDTLRADHLGCYGYARPTSPRLDALAAESTVLEACWSASNFTAPAFTSLFTGLCPSRHGVFDFGGEAASSPIKRVLDANGARTAGVVTFRFFKRLLGRIWGSVEAVTDTRSFDYSKDLPRAVSDGAIEWLERHGRGAPFCLFLHYNGPHAPFRLPPEYEDCFGPAGRDGVGEDLKAVFHPRESERIGDNEGPVIGPMFRLMERINAGRRRLTPRELAWYVDLYDAAVRYNDEEVGRVLAALRDLGLDDDTVVCVLSDHGEELMRHGHLGHGGMHMYEETLRTVGLVRDPARRESRRVPAPCGHTDILPLLLRLAGARDLPEAWSGRDILDPAGPPSPVFSVGELKSAVRLDGLKLVRARPAPQLGRIKRLRLWAKMALYRELGDELYDLAADPGETRNLASDRRLRRPLGELLARHLAKGAAAPAAAGRDAMDPEERARLERELKDLGYM